MFCLINTCVHGEDFIVSEEICNLLGVLAKHVRIECSGCVMDDFGLFLEGFQNLWVAMAEIVGRVAAEEVEISFSFHVPNMYTCERKIVL